MTETINEYKCVKHKVIVKAHVKQSKMIDNRLLLSPEEYFLPLPEDNKEKEKVVKVAKDVKKTVESSLWLSNEFPLKISNFLTVLKTLSLGGNASMSKMKDFMKNDTLKEVVKQNGFPVKI